MHTNELKQFRRNTADPRMKQLFAETQIPDGTCFIESLEIDRLDGRSWGYDNHIQASGLLYRNGQTEEYFYDEADVDLKSFFDSHKDCIFISDGNLRIGDELEELDLSTRLRKINTCEKYFSWFHAPTSINIEMFSAQYEKAKHLLAKQLSSANKPNLDSAIQSATVRASEPHSLDETQSKETTNER